MQHPERKGKKQRKTQKSCLCFFFIWYFTKFIWRKSWIVLFVCFVLKLPFPKWMMSFELRWGQVGFQSTGSSLLHPKGILGGFGILQIFSLETLGGARYTAFSQWLLIKCLPSDLNWPDYFTGEETTLHEIMGWGTQGWGARPPRGGKGMSGKACWKLEILA